VPAPEFFPVNWIAMTSVIPPSLLTALLLIGSNAFMTTAWYW
jgi:uncharacterized protein (DUF486 family)